MNKTPMTKYGSDLLRKELDTLKHNERPRIIKAIAEARAHGDLKENAEYHAAKEEQGFIEGRISEIEQKLAHAQIIEVSALPQTGKVVFGTTVRLFDLDTETEVTYQIVGDDEADIKHNKISISSPIARAIIGKDQGDVVVVQAPKGEIEYEISEVLYLE